VLLSITLASATRLFFGLTAIVLAQEPIRVTTRLVQTEVIVRDQHGPVGDLTTRSFKIFEDGKEQMISVFRASKTAGPASATAVSLPPGVFTNRLPGARVERSTVLLIDTLNTELADQTYVRRQLLEMLAKIEIRDPIAIHILGEKFRVLHDFSTDRESLRKAVEGFKPEHSLPLFMSNTPTPRMPGGSRETAESITRAYKDLRDLSVRGRTSTTLDVFEELLKQLGRVEGRKSIVWISNAFPVKFLRDRPEVMLKFNRADIAIYPVHARGLVVKLDNPRDPGGPASTSLPEEQATLQSVAQQTGGRAFFNRNDLSDSVREAIDDGQVTYTLGFYSARERPDGNYHSLKVKVERHGTEVRHRAGFFDVETKPAVDAPRDENKIGLVAAVGRSGENFQVAVQVDFNDLALELRDGRWTGSAELGFVSQAADGRTLDVASKKLSFDMTDEAYRARQRDGFALEQLIPARQDAVRIRVVLVDSSGATGLVSMTPLPKL
jgi:VWFA-related protein